MILQTCFILRFQIKKSRGVFARLCLLRQNERQNISAQILCEYVLVRRQRQSVSSTVQFQADSGSAEARPLRCAHHHTPQISLPSWTKRFFLLRRQMDQKLSGDRLFQPDSRFLMHPGSEHPGPRLLQERVNTSSLFLFLQFSPLASMFAG